MLDQMETIPGWYDRQEGALLESAALGAPSGACVEIGSYHGRSTVVLASVRFTTSIDPHEGISVKGGSGTPTLEAFEANASRCGVRDNIAIVRQPAQDVAWRGSSIGMLHIDGLHDYENARGDFEHFRPFLAKEAIVCFHDYLNIDLPDVARVVDELVSEGVLERVAHAGSLVVLRFAQ
jgi:hypothetical protein